MLKDPEMSRYSIRRTHRTYTPEFKAELVAACQVGGASIAALARQHAMNANVLHRWLKEHERSGCHGLVARSAHGVAALASPAAAFMPVQLSAPTAAPKERQITVELHKGALSMAISWPVSAAADLASWTAAILK